MLTPKKKAADTVLALLRNPLAALSKPDREDVQRLAQEHALSALDLIEAALRRAKRA